MTAGSTNSGKFVWPPRPLTDAEAGPPTDPTYWKAQGREPPLVVTRPVDVVARPRPIDQSQQPAPAAPASLEEARARPASSWLRQVETAWFGLTRASLAERAEDEGWAPDAPEAYCSRCGGSVGLHEETEEGCRVCRGKRLHWKRFVRLGEYHSLVRDVVHEVKFTAWRRLGMDAGRMLGKQIAPMLEGVDPERLVLVPVPSTFRRRMARGIDHTLVLARGVRELTGGRIVRALARRHRPSQVGLPLTERKRNVSGTMRVRGRAQLEGCVVLVIDDVRTTGATMSEACRALVRGLKEQGIAPAEVWAAVLGVAVEKTGPDARPK